MWSEFNYRPKDKTQGKKIKSKNIVGSSDY